MPIVHLTTNIARAVFTHEFILKMSVLVAHLMNETPKDVELIIMPDNIISFINSQEPAAHLSITSVLGLEEERRRYVGKYLYDFLVKELELQSLRFFITLNPITATQLIYTGRTINDYFGNKKPTQPPRRPPANRGPGQARRPANQARRSRAIVRHTRSRG